jgi:hypothetical protein
MIVATHNHFEIRMARIVSVESFEPKLAKSSSKRGTASRPVRLRPIDNNVAVIGSNQGHHRGTSSSSAIFEQGGVSS